MFLEHVGLRNIRSIRSLELPLTSGDGSRKWTFLLGENGIGKSTVLRSIALALAGSEALPELLGSPDEWVRNGSSEGSIRLQLRTAAGDEREISLVLHRGDNLRQVFDRNGQLLEQLDAALEHTDRSYFTVGYGVSRHPSHQDFSPKKGQFRHPRAAAVATLFSTEAELTSLEHWAMDLDYRREGALDVVRDALEKLLPGVSMLDIDRENRRLLFETPDGTVPFKALSDGYQNVAAWTGDLLWNITDTFEDYRDPLSTRGLLLIDEIGLHLHPTWQRQLMGFMEERLPNFQIIATTHSPLTVHQAGEDELYFLRRGADGAPELHGYDGAPRNLMLHQLLTSPLFGLTTLDSMPVEHLKQEYRDLRELEAPDENQSQRLRELTEQLGDLPDWSDGIEGQSEVKDLLSDIKAALNP